MKYMRYEMITKQQALEFIYELSNLTEVRLNLTQGYLLAETFHFHGEEIPNYGVEGCGKTINQVVKAFVENIYDTELLEVLKQKQIPIPIDVDMLEVGQTYKVHIQKDWDHGFFTAKFLGFDEEDDYVVKFENNKPYTKFDITEIYKVNND